VANLVVVNDGEPISPERLPYLFERFYRGDEAHSEQIEGFGLGLSLAKNIVDAHGGLIRVSSTVEDGTAFTVSLPALEADS
jgi:two-component system sensor histidine kinase VicK